MEEKIVLRLRYIHNEYAEIVVDDPDKCSILDILVDMIEESQKIGMILPEHPALWYAHNSQNFQLESDNDVMKMFTIFHGVKIIKVDIGSAESPSKNLESAYGLIRSKKYVENSLFPKSSHGSQPTSSRRVPKTSARRKEILVKQSVSSSPSVVSQPISGDLSRTDVALLENVLPETVLNEVVLAETVMDVVFDKTVAAETTVADPNLPTLDVQSVIEPYVADIESESDSDADTEVESDCSDEGIHEDYFDRVYDNGEAYGEHSFGVIKLEPWMIFQDKDHLMDVLRDFCIQEGVTLVVLKTDFRRYTALCGDSNCKWRIHASRLSDEVTWAIKTLNGVHTCLKVRKFNSMATPEWAATKIIGLVRGDTEIKGLHIQNFLFEKYGINLRRTSLYKARSIKEAISCCAVWKMQGVWS